MRLFLSRLHFPVTTLGPGRRVGIWFRGCSLRFPGCVSADTWAPERGATTVEAVLDSIAPWLAVADGITISGGEPFEQVDALASLLRAIRERAKAACDVLMYSGFAWERIAAQVSEWPALVDALISDPFRAEAGQTLVWRGSDNQRMHLLTELGRARCAQWVDAPRTSLPQGLDVFFEDGEVWMAGIPEPGTLDKLREQLATTGLQSTTSQARDAGTAPIFA
jgi:anaerobic ribonucleoside-triphosphate reductase activating protein